MLLVWRKRPLAGRVGKRARPVRWASSDAAAVTGRCVPRSDAYTASSCGCCRRCPCGPVRGTGPLPGGVRPDYGLPPLLPEEREEIGSTHERPRVERLDDELA